MCEQTWKPLTVTVDGGLKLSPEREELVSILPPTHALPNIARSRQEFFSFEKCLAGKPHV
jgi:hypothetical protein